MFAVTCPCGEDHALTPAAAAAFELLADGHAAAVPVPAAGTAVMVPVAWVLCHGLAGADIAMAASLHGWERA